MHSLDEGPTRIRSIRVPDKSWDLAMTIADHYGDPLSQVIRDMLDAYIARNAHILLNEDLGDDDDDGELAEPDPKVFQA